MATPTSVQTLHHHQPSNTKHQARNFTNFFCLFPYFLWYYFLFSFRQSLNFVYIAIFISSILFKCSTPPSSSPPWPPQAPSPPPGVTLTTITKSESSSATKPPRPDHRRSSREVNASNNLPSQPGAFWDYRNLRQRRRPEPGIPMSSPWPSRQTNHRLARWQHRYHLLWCRQRRLDFQNP